MDKKRSKLTRRDFIAGTAGAALAGAVGGATGCRGKDQTPPKAPGPAADKAAAPKKKPAETPPPGKRATVVLVRDKDVIDGSRAVKGPVIERMLDEAMATLLGTPTAEEAWGQLFGPEDTVGIKSNVWRFLSTPRELEEAIRARVIGAGVGADRVDIDDRGVRSNPVFGKATALINVRPSRTHHWSGVGSLIKNYIMFSETPSSWHDDSCANLAGVWDLPEVKGKTRLNILVMLTPLFHSKGPHDYQATYTWPYKGLIVGTDPVAVDATGLRILEAKRDAFFGSTSPFTVPPKHITVADEKYGLGVADPRRIDLVKLGWEDDVLV